METDDLVILDCAHAVPCTASVVGACCSLGHYGGKPSPGVCLKACRHRVPLTIGATEAASTQGSDPQDTPATNGFLAKAASYLKAEASRFLDTISDEEIAQRRDACRGCEALQRSDNPEQIGWCTRCGCGTNSRAEITVKSTMPAATCPLNKWRR